MRMLIVDDSKMMTEMIERQIRLAGHEVVGVSHDALGITNLARKLAEDEPLVVILDIDWPGMRGYGLHVAKLLKKLDHVRVVLCSSKTVEEIRQAARAAVVEVDGWISKSDAPSIANYIEKLPGGAP